MQLESGGNRKKQIDKWVINKRKSKEESREEEMEVQAGGTDPSMNEFLNSAGGKASQETRALTMLWHKLKGLDLILPIEEYLDSFPIDSD